MTEKDTTTERGDLTARGTQFRENIRAGKMKADHAFVPGDTFVVKPGATPRSVQTLLLLGLDRFFHLTLTSDEARKVIRQGAILRLVGLQDDEELIVRVCKVKKRHRNKKLLEVNKCSSREPGDPDPISLFYHNVRYCTKQPLTTVQMA